MEIWEAIEKNESLLDEYSSQLASLWNDWAVADNEYRRKKSKAILSLRAEGVPSTLINEIVRGIDEISNLDLKRSIAEGLYREKIERINVLKQKAQDLRMYFDKEYYDKQNI